jgi:uncharacterized protein (UPF0332 family)
VQPGILPARFGRFYSRVFDERWSSDYEDFTEFDKETVEALFAEAREFLDAIHTILNSAGETPKL